MRPSDRDIREIIARVHARLSSVIKTVDARNGEHKRKREQQLHEIISDVVREYYGRVVEGFDNIVRRVKEHFSKGSDI